MTWLLLLSLVTFAGTLRAETIVVDDDSTEDIELPAGGTIFDVQVNPTDPFYYTYSGIISGAGSLTKTGSGELFLTSGNTYTGPTIVTGGTLRIANYTSINANSLGNLVSGAGSSLTSNTAIQIGDTGTGSLDILNGGAVTATMSVQIGNTNGISGVVNVSGAGSSLTMSSATIGINGIGLLNITDGGSAHAGAQVNLGTSDTGNGTLNLSGLGSELTSTSLGIGVMGIGQMNISDQATATVESITLGTTGIGRLNITGGGTATTTGSARIGAGNGGIGVVNISGAGSSLITNSLMVGSNGAGFLHVTDGGMVSSSTNIVVGNGAGGGTLNVFGTGEISATGIYIGGNVAAAVGTGLLAGTGTITTSGTDGVKVWSTGTISPGDYAGQVGTLNISGNLNMDGGTIRVDIEAGNTGDMIDVTGTATFNNEIFVDVTSVHTASTYDFITSGGAMTDSGTTWTARLNGENIVGTRAAGLIAVNPNYPGNKIELDITQGTNVTLAWTGSNGGDWDLTSSAWTGPEYTFLDGDIVTFSGINGEIDIAGSGKTVAQMTITGDPSAYVVFNGNILADGTKTTLGVNNTGKLIMNSALGTTGTAEFNGENEFMGGVQMNGGRLILGHDRALGTFETAGTLEDSRGQVHVLGAGTVETTENRTISNRFYVDSNSTGALTLDIAEDTTLTIENVENTDNGLSKYGGAIGVYAEDGLQFANPSGHLVVRNSSAAGGGGIAFDASASDAVLDFSNLQSLTVSDNLGGGVYAATTDGDAKVTFGENTTISGNATHETHPGGSTGGSGVYVHGTNAASLTFGEHTILEGNTSSLAIQILGGGFHVEAATTVSVSIGSDSIIRNNRGNRAGAGYFDGESSLLIKSMALIEGNRATSAAEDNAGAFLLQEGLEVRGNTLFKGNYAAATAGISAGAILLTGSGGVEVESKINSAAFGGDIAFTGNYRNVTFDANFNPTNLGTTAEASSIHLEQYTKLVLNGDGYMYFDDPISSGTGGGNSLIKQGNSDTGFVQFAGTNVLNPAGQGGGNVEIYNGAFRLAPSATFTTQGTGATFSVGTFGTLAGSGTITAQQGFTITGTISPDADRFEIPTGLGTLSAAASRTTIAADKKIGTLTLTGAVELDGANLIVDLGAANASDQIAIDGNLTFGTGMNTVKIDNGAIGTFTILTATNIADVGDPITDYFTVDAGARRSGELAWIGNTGIQLTANSGLNDAITWTGTNGTWNTTQTDNWTLSDSEAGLFMSSDSVTFNNSATTKTVTVDAAGVIVSGMTVSGGAYTFSGGAITGVTAISGNNFTPTGKLQITSGSADFDLPLSFSEGIEISAGASAVFSGTTGRSYDSAITNAGSFEMNVGNGTVHAYSGVISGAGTVTKSGAGTVELTAANTATGAFSHNAGAVQLNGNWGGAYTQAATAGAFSNSSPIAIGGAVTLNATANIDNNLTVTTGNLILDGTTGITAGTTSTATAGSTVAIGNAADTNAVTTISSGATLSNNGTIVVGNSGTGTLYVDSGATVTSNHATDASRVLNVGNNTGAVGTINVSGTGALTNFYNLNVGVSGTGTLNLSGGAQVTVSNAVTLGANASGSGTMMLSGGTSKLTANSLALGRGAGDSTALLGGTGTADADNVYLYAGGKIAPGDTAGEIGTLNIDGILNINGGTLSIDLPATGSTSDLVAVTGNVAINSASIVDISAWQSGTYTILTATGTIADPTDQFTVTLGGNTLTDRQGASVALNPGNAKELQLSTYTNNLALNWTGDTNDTWNGTQTGNWQRADTTAETFLAGDTVSFGAAGVTSFAVTIDGGGVRVSDMIVSDGMYTFHGGAITGNTTVSGTSLVAPTGKLKITGGNATFHTGLSFTGGIEIANGAMATFSGDMDRTYTSTIANEGSFEMAVDIDKTHTYSGVISGDGTFTKTDDGTLILTAANSATGAFTHQAGAVTLNGDWGGDYTQTATAGVFSNTSAATIDGVVTFNATANIGANLAVGDELTLDGTANISAGTTLSSASDINVGNSGSGTLILNTGALVSAADEVRLGNLAGSSGTVMLLGGATTKIVSAGDVYVGGTDVTSAVLGGTGTVQAGLGTETVYLSNKGIISPGDTAGEIGTLNIDGILELDGGTLKIDLPASGSTSDLVAVTGDVEINSASIVDISAWQSGTYTILTSGGAIDDPAGQFSVTLGGVALSGRQNATVALNSQNAQELQLTTFANNFALTWTGGTNGTWNSTQTGNWQRAGAVAETFIDGDTVTFGATGAQSITVDAGGVRVSDMNITGGDYGFTGGQITGSTTVDGSDIAAPTGGLNISGGSASFSNISALFVGNTNISAGTLHVASTASIGSANVLINGPTASVTGTGQLNTTGGTGNVTLSSGASISPGDTPGTVGTLNIAGNLVLDGGTLQINLASTSSYDSIVLDAENSVTFGMNKNTISVDQWIAGTFDIVTIADGGTGTVADLSLAFNDIVFTVATNDRQGSAVQRSTDLKSIQLVMTAGMNLALSWNATDGVWDTTSENWLYSGDAAVKTFFDGDTVTFGGTGTKTVTLDADRTVSGMTVSGGEYTFSGSGKIIGDPTVKGSAIVAPTGQLEISGAGTIVNLNVETDFVNGTELSAGTLVLGHDAALGTIAANDKGHVKILGDATVRTETDRTLNNRFTVRNNAELAVGIASGTTLTLDGTNSTTGALLDATDGTIRFDAADARLVVRNGNDSAAVGTTLDFSSIAGLVVSGNTSPSRGGAVFVTESLFLSGDTLFSNNLATVSGGAIHLDGTGTSNLVSLDAEGGDIAFTGNTVGATANSIHLERNGALQLSGRGNIYFDDPISSGAAGGNSLTKTGTGTVQFVGDNVLNLAGTPAGNVSVSAGTFRVVNGASFTTQGTGSSFGLANGATLAGGGSVTAEQGFTISGTISPDVARFAIPTALDGSADAPTIANGDRIGTLSLTGDALFSGATLQIDLGTGVSDRIDVNGNVSFALDGARRNTVDVGLWSVGTYTVLSGSGVADITDLFDNVTVGGNALGSRQSAVLSRGAGNTELILTTSGGNNVDLFWTGAAGNLWNTTDANWAAGETYNADDYAIFDASGANQNVIVNGLLQVSGMKISGGNYSFSGTGSIAGTAPTSNGQTVTGKLELASTATTTIKVATDFVGGTEISAGTVVVGHDAAFGAIGTTDKGHVKILGDATLQTEANRTLNNRFTVLNGAELSIGVASGTTLTLDGTNSTSGALLDATNGSLQVDGNGAYLVVRNAADGALIANELDFSSFAGVVFSGNSTTTRGGALYVTDSAIVSGNSLFANNSAAVSGGAIDLAGSGATNVLQLDAEGGDIAFTGNTVGVSANSIHLERNGELRLSGSGNIFFDDPISGGAAGGNRLVKDGAGTVQFAGDSVLNVAGTPAGNVAVNAGTFRVVDGASFTTQGTGSTFGVSSGAALAGGGTIAAGNGFSISGTISPDSARFTVPTDLSVSITPLVADTDRIGTLVLNGDVDLDGAVLAVDLAADGTTSDRITINGNLTYGANSSVDLGIWNIGVFTILSGGQLDLSKFGTVTIGGNTIGSRQSATLAVDGNLLKLTTSGGGNLDLAWTGTVGNLWNTSDGNWTASETYNANDFVIFDASGQNRDIVVDGSGVQVSGMEVVEGAYSFEGGKITGTTPTSAGQRVTGRLDLIGGSARLAVETDFASGIQLNGGTMIVAHDKALGTDDGSTSRGTLEVIGSGHLNTEGDRSLSNRVFARSGGHLQIGVAANSTLAMDGTQVAVENDASLTFTTGSGDFVAKNSTDSAFVNAGSLDFTGLRSLKILDNRTAGNGGGISTTDNLVVSGNSLFSGNTAADRGGAIYADHATVTLNATNGDIAFTGNSASGRSNSLHLESNSSLQIVGGNVYFDDPISSGAGGGNNLTKTGSGFVQFVGDSVLNSAGAPAGSVSVTGGTFRVVNGATFTTGNLQSAFQLGPGGSLAGGGTIVSENGFTLSGFISPDKHRFPTPSNLDGSTYPIIPAQDAIGTLHLTGDVTLDGATLAVDLSDGNLSDKLEVDGNVTLGTENSYVTIAYWLPGTYNVLSATGTIDSIDDRIFVEYIGETIDVQNAWLQMNGNTVQLVLSQYAPDNFNEWTLETGGQDGILNQTTFSGDVLVHYNGRGTEMVNVTGIVPMAGLIASAGKYKFVRATKDDDTSKIVITANPKLEGQRFNGKFVAMGEGTILDVGTEVDAEYGNYVENATVILSHDLALGDYGDAIATYAEPAGGEIVMARMMALASLATYTPNEDNYKDARGQTTVVGNATLGIGKEIFAKNRFVITSGSTLNLAGTSTAAVTFSGVRTSGVDGSIFHVATNATLAIRGYTTVTDNETTGLGGAVFLEKNSTLNLDGSEGGIEITGNRDVSGNTDIAFGSTGNTINILGTGDLGGIVLGTIRPAAQSTGNKLVVDTDSFLQTESGQMNDVSATLFEAVLVKKGSWREIDGGFFDGGDNTSIGVLNDGILAGGGTFHADQFDIAGSFAPDRAVFRSSSKVVRSELQAGVLTLDGDVRLDGATLVTDLKRGNVSDKVVAIGAVTYGNDSILNVNAWQAGTFVVFEAESGLVGDVAANHFENVRFGGEELVAGGRLSANFKTEGNTLVLETGVTERMNLRWTGGDGNGLLNMASTGNWVDENDKAAQFAPTDFLFFDTTGRQGTITLGNDDGSTGGRTVSGVLFSGGEYTLEGGDLFGIKTGTDDGNLIVSEGRIGFRNNVFFEGNIQILNNSQVTLEGRNAFHAEEDFHLAETASITMQVGDDLIRGRSVTLDGTITLTGEPTPTTRRSPRFYDMIAATETALDADRLSEIFNYTVGLLNRNAVVSEDGMSMDLLYTATPLDQYARDKEFSENKTSYADYFKDTFNSWEMEDFELELMKLNDEQLGVLFDELAATSLLAEAKLMALSNPYRTVARHFLDDDDPRRFCPEIYRSSNRRSRCSTRNFWFVAQQREIEQDGDGNANAYRISRTGMYLGGDYRISSRLLAGFLFGYGNPKLYRNTTRIEADDLTFGGYAKFRLNSNWDLNGFVAYGNQDYSSRRWILGQKAEGSHNGDALFSTLELVRRVRLADEFTLLPTLALDYQKAWADAYTESGASMAQSFEKSDIDETVLRFGLNTRWNPNCRTRLDTRLQYGRRLDGNDGTSIRTSLLASSADPMTLRGVVLGRDLFNVGVGGHYLFGQAGQSRIYGNYDFDRGNRSKAHTAELGFQHAW